LYSGYYENSQLLIESLLVDGLELDTIKDLEEIVSVQKDRKSVVLSTIKIINDANSICKKLADRQLKVFGTFSNGETIYSKVLK